eukprot:m.49782 g.49782  ORF g.49782 m.49782 type:complete len:66 (+) comp7468_c0_seq1:224-421(+)
MLSRMLKIVNSASIDPAAPSKCPVAPFVDVTARGYSLLTFSTSRRAIALHSISSPNGVDVACAFT